MRKTSLSIKKTRVNGLLFWQVTAPKLGGGRERRTFKDRAEASAFFETAKIQQENYGTAALSISDGLRVQAVECETRLAKFGKSLRDATDFYLAHLKTIAGSRSVREVVAEILAARETDGASVRYLGDLRARLARFAAAFGDAMIASVTTRQIGEWLRGLGVGGVTRNSYRRRLAALFNFARRQGYLVQSPIADVDKAKERSGEIKILTLDQTSRLLEAASAETLPYWAIGAFAGLRSAEIGRLNWADVDFEDGLIEVKGNHKTASRRFVPMSDSLREWLAPYRASKGDVCPMGLRKKLEADRERAGLREDWPSNALRHGYGSYRLPMITDVARLALEMGNSPAMVFKHYREIVKPALAKRYWEISPTKAKNIVRMVG